jgi:hypothetical protein
LAGLDYVICIGTYPGFRRSNSIAVTTTNTEKRIPKMFKKAKGAGRLSKLLGLYSDLYQASLNGNSLEVCEVLIMPY